MGRVLLLVALTVAAAAQDLTPALEARFRDSVEALRSGKLDLAETLLESIIAKGARAPVVYHNLGVIQQQRGRHAEAILRFRDAAKLDPEFAPSSLLLGVSLAAEGRKEEAVTALEKAVRLDPEQPRARLELARVYERLGRMPAAVQQYEKLRASRPDDTEIAYQLARSYERLSAWAEERLQCAASGTARLHQLRGEVLLRSGQQLRATEEFVEAAAADPKLAGVHLGLATVFMKQNRAAEALDEVDRELLLSPESAAALQLKKQLLSSPGTIGTNVRPQTSHR